MRLFRSIIFLLLFSGFFTCCNLFNWSYSEEVSNDIPTVITGAEAAFLIKDYRKAIALYERALLLNPKDNYPRFRKLQCLLLSIDSTQSLLSFHSRLFSATAGTTDPLYKDKDGIAAIRLLANSSQAYHLLPFTSVLSNGFWSSRSETNSAVLSDSALACALYGLMLLQDSTTNKIPFEGGDIGYISDDFTYIYPQPASLSPAEKTNLSLQLTKATNSLSKALYYLDSLSDTTLFLQNMKINLIKTTNQVTTAITNLGVF